MSDNEETVRCRKCRCEIRWFQSHVSADNSRWLSSINGAWCVDGEKHEPD